MAPGGWSSTASLSSSRGRSCAGLTWPASRSKGRVASARAPGARCWSTGQGRDCCTCGDSESQTLGGVTADVRQIVGVLPASGRLAYRHRGSGASYLCSSPSWRPRTVARLAMVGVGGRGDCGEAAVVQHGVDPNGSSGAYDFETMSDIDPSLPQEATVPAVCGILNASMDLPCPGAAPTPGPVAPSTAASWACSVQGSASSRWVQAPTSSAAAPAPPGPEEMAREAVRRRRTARSPSRRGPGRTTSRRPGATGHRRPVRSARR